MLMLKFRDRNPTRPESSTSVRNDLRRDERGAQLIEFVLVTPVILALLLGITTGGIAFNQSISVGDATRETARFGATLPINGDLTGWLNQVADVAVSAATGTLNDGIPGRVICVSYVHPDGATAADQTMALRVYNRGTRVASSQPCFQDQLPDSERRVQVKLARESDLLVFYFTKTVNLNSGSAVRFERF